MRGSERVVMVSFVAIAVCFFVLLYLYNSLENDYVSLYGKYLGLEEDYNDLQDQYYAVSSELRSTEQELQSTKDTLNECELNYDYAMEHIQSYLHDLREYNSILWSVYTWISGNRDLNLEIASQVTEDCFRGDTLVYPCILYDYHGKETFHYVPDPDEHFKSLSEFLRDRGGDCEDWALFGAAVVRYAIQRGASVEFFYPDGFGRIDLRGRWYLPHVTPKTIMPISVSVVCGTKTPDANEGHCVDYIEATDGNYYVEPQTGEIYLVDPVPFRSDEVTFSDYCFYRDDGSKVCLDDLAFFRDFWVRTFTNLLHGDLNGFEVVTVPTGCACDGFKIETVVTTNRG